MVPYPWLRAGRLIDVCQRFLGYQADICHCPHTRANGQQHLPGRDATKRATCEGFAVKVAQNTKTVSMLYV